MPLTITGAEGTFLKMKKKKETMPITVDPVKLKPFLGMQPGVYLTILYALILLLVLFLVGFLPGLLHSGKRVTFTSAVAPAVVSVDGTYVGSTPVVAFIEPGEHEATFSHQGVGQVTVPFEVSHPVFLTWLIPRKQTVAVDSFIHDIPAFKQYLESMYEQVVSWSAITDFTDTYHRPPLFDQVAQSALSSQLQGHQESLHTFYLQSLNHMTSQVMLRDFIESVQEVAYPKLLSDAQTQELMMYIERIEPLFNAEEGSAMVGSQSADQAISFVRTSLSVPIEGLSPITGFSYGSDEVVIGKPVTRTYPGVHEMGIETTVGSFSIAALETSEYLWAQFIAANPYWSKTNIEQLIADGMVDNQYLAGIYPTTVVESTHPIRNISWYAAQAFTSWLTQITGKDVFLPSQAQWESAARSVEDKPYQKTPLAMIDSSGPSAMLGGYWEFTSSGFSPLERFTEIEATWQSISEAIVIKGGSLLNDPAEIDRSTVGVLSRDACSDSTGFRIAWAD